MGKKKDEFWLSDPEEHDYAAAQDYLDFLFNNSQVSDIVHRLKKEKTILKKAKDILRSSQLTLLPKDNVHVKANIKKVSQGKKMSPVLLVRGQPMVIADGYHRVCAIYYLSEDLIIPCRLTDR